MLHTSPKTAILGAGIAGLSAAFFLKRQGHQVTVFEKEAEPGGNIRSRLQGGFTCESGPNTVLLNHEGMVRLLEDTGLLGQVISPDPAANKNRFILHKGRMEHVPLGPLGLLRTRLLGSKDKLRLLREPFVAPHPKEAHPSLKAFAERRFGRRFYEHFLLPFVTGIYAGDPARMSARHAMKVLWESEQEGGSVFRGFLRRRKRQQRLDKELRLPRQKVFTLDGGLETLVQALAEYLEPNLRRESAVTGLGFAGGKYEVHLQDGSEIFDQVMAAVPARALAEWLSAEDPLLSQQLAAVEYVPVVVMHLGFAKSQVRDHTPGFGVLALPAEQRSYLGILFNTRTFPHTAPPGHELFTVIIGGARSPELTRLSDAALRSRVLGELDELLGISGDPVFEHLVRWPQGIPQYGLDHGTLLKAVENFEASHPGFHIVGNYVRGVSVSECVEKGFMAAATC